jgi:hypothetical protein
MASKTNSANKRMTPTQARAARRMRRQRRRRVLRWAGFITLIVVSMAFIAALFLPSLTFTGGLF